MNKVKCRTCTRRFFCLAKHYIPENYGNDCKDYCDQDAFKTVA